MYGKSERFEDYHQRPGRAAAGMAFALMAGAQKKAPPAPCCQVLLARSGAIRVSTRGTVWVCASGNALLLAPGAGALIESLSDCVVHAALVRTRERAWRAADARRMAVTELVRALLAELVQLPAGSTAPRARRIGQLLVEEIRLEEIPPIGLPKPADPRLARACAAVLAEPALAWNAQALAARAGMSARSLARHFVAQVGVAPARWCRAVRLTSALTEVARGGTLHAAAAAAGFAGPASLCAAFKQATGTTLRQYFRGQPVSEGGDEAAFFG